MLGDEPMGSFDFSLSRFLSVGMLVVLPFFDFGNLNFFIANFHLKCDDDLREI